MGMRKVIIGDGSVFMRVMLRNMVKRLDFEVVAVCKSCKEVADKYMATKPDMALIDLGLNNEMDCVTLTRAITKDDPAANVILLVPEGSDDPDVQDVIVEAVRAGVKGYIRKPLSPEGFEARLGKMLKREKEK